MCHLRRGQGAEKRKRASERAEFTVIELSVFCCVTAPQVATEMRKHFYKNVISLQTSFIYFIPFPCLFQSGSDLVNKTEPGSRLVHYRLLDSQLASFNRCIHVNMFTQRSILYSIQKHISVLHIPPQAGRPTCLSERFTKKAELFGGLTISLSLSKCIFSVNPSFQRQDMKS